MNGTELIPLLLLPLGGVPHDGWSVAVSTIRRQSVQSLVLLQTE